MSRSLLSRRERFELAGGWDLLQVVGAWLAVAVVGALAAGMFWLADVQGDAYAAWDGIGIPPADGVLWFVGGCVACIATVCLAGMATQATVDAC